MAPTDKSKNAPKTKGGKSKSVKKPTNYVLASGVMRYSRSQMSKRKAVWRLKGKKAPAIKKEKTPLTITKEIGGANNGGKRAVKLIKPRGYYATKPRVTKRPSHGCFKRHVRFTRRSLNPGRVLILLAGRHKGKRVVLLRVLASGLLLVSGPFALNSCPLRRISQRYVISTKTQIDISKVQIPEHINDTYFKRKSAKKQNRGEGEIFATKKERFVPSEQRKADQVTVDKAIGRAIGAQKDKKLLFKYLASPFALRSSQYPHRMTF